MLNFKKVVALLGITLMCLQGVPGLNLSNDSAKAATYSPAMQELMSRPYPRLMGNQWHVTPDGTFGSGDTQNKINFAAKYMDIIGLNRASGNMNDLFLDFYQSTHDPSKGLLKTRNDIYTAASAAGRKVYVLAYHNMTDVWNYESVAKFPNENFWMKPDGQNIGTWDFMDNHNYWLRGTDGSIIAYPSYSSSQRRMWDSRKPEVQEYWAQHAKGITDQGFDGIFADNWLRSGFAGPDRVGVQTGWNTTGARFKAIAPNKILVGNSPPLGVFTSRDVCMLEDRIANVLTGDKSITGYLAYSDQAANMGQVCLDTYWDESVGSFETFRVPMVLLTDNVLGLTLNTKQGHSLDHQRIVIEKLGKIGFPKGPRYRANGILQRDFDLAKTLVNDTAQSVTVSLPAGVYKDLNGNSVNSVTLSSCSGIVLKKSGSVTPPPTPVPPTAPSNCTVTGVTKGATTNTYYVNLTWKDNSTDETGFKVLQSINSENNFQVVSTSSVNAATYAVSIGTSPTAGTYYYKVVATNASGDSTASNTASTPITSSPPPSTPVPPIAPSNCTITGVSKGATSGNVYVNLTWKDNSTDETGFKIFQSVNSESNFQVIKTPAANGTGYGINIGSSPTSGTYYYKVVAVNANGDSAASNTASTSIGQVTPPPTPVPTAPSNLTATPYKDITGKNVVILTWKDNSSNETGFNLYTSNSDTGSFTKIGTIAENAVVLAHITDGSSTKILYQIKAVNAGGESGVSNTVSVTLN